MLEMLLTRRPDAQATIPTRTCMQRGLHSKSHTVDEVLAIPSNASGLFAPQLHVEVRVTFRRH